MVSDEASFGEGDCWDWKSGLRVLIGEGFLGNMLVLGIGDKVITVDPVRDFLNVGRREFLNWVLLNGVPTGNLEEAPRRLLVSLFFLVVDEEVEARIEFIKVGLVCDCVNACGETDIGALFGRYCACTILSNCAAASGRSATSPGDLLAAINYDVTSSIKICIQQRIFRNLHQKVLQKLDMGEEAL